MGPFWHIEAGALRLASFGLGVMLTYLVVLRLHDIHTKRPLRPCEQRVKPVSVAKLCTLALLVASAIFATTAMAIVAHFPDWLADPEPAPSHLLHLPITAIAVMVIDLLAYHPDIKRRWCGGWIVLAHVVQWGGFLLATR